jgi:hypothetical protein
MVNRRSEHNGTFFGLVSFAAFTDPYRFVEWIFPSRAECVVPENNVLPKQRRNVGDETHPNRPSRKKAARSNNRIRQPAAFPKLTS